MTIQNAIQNAIQNGDETIRFPIKRIFSERKILKGALSVPKRRFSFPALLLALLFVVFVLFVPPAVAEEKNLADAFIIDGYVILRDEMPHIFQQGYSVSLIGFGADNVLIEFRSNYSTPDTLGSVVLKEGESVQCYRQDSEGINLVLVMTLDKLYLNSSQVLAGFSNVYQLYDTSFGNYSASEDWILYAGVLDDPSVPVRPENPSGNGTYIRPDLISEPLYIILIIGLTALAVITIAIFSKRNSRRKNKRKQSNKEKEEIKKKG
ncbi:MAG: hypothetical protein FWE54_05230 [Methanimicrococcus sp.]|nr:hypothetical protein [Methanimicrococcus sp.]